MALIARYLVDTSAAALMDQPLIAARIGPLIEAGLVATTALLDAQALFCTRHSQEYERVWANRREAYEYLPTTDAHWQTAMAAQRDLVARGRATAARIPVLLTAAVAADHHLTVIHADEAFAAIGEVLAVFERRVVGAAGA